MCERCCWGELSFSTESVDSSQSTQQADRPELVFGLQDPIRAYAISPARQPAHQT